MEASPYQIASAYSVFANNGIYKEFTIVMNNEYKYEEQIISAESANKILFALHDVVENGSGKNARVSGFNVGGKTGTSHRSSKDGGYEKSIYTASFVGIAPLETKDLTIFVSIYQPGLNAYTGGDIAAPLFSCDGPYEHVPSEGSSIDEFGPSHGQPRLVAIREVWIVQST